MKQCKGTGATLDAVEEEEVIVRCHRAVRRAREDGLTDEQTATVKYGATPVDTKWFERQKAFEREPMQVRSRFVAREFQSGDRPDSYAGTPPLGGLKAIFSIAANHAH